MKIGRNDPCPCGSGKKYKHCCYAKDSVKQAEEAPPVADDAAETDAEDHDSDDNVHTHPKKDRSRFQGDVKGGTNAFRPRATRGAQRGS